MRDTKSGIPLKTQCDFLGVSTSGYYAWQARPVSLDERRKRRRAIDEAVKMAFYQHKQRYGSPRISVELNDEGWVYLAIVLDLYSRRIIGWSMSKRMNKQLVCDAMQMAIKARQPTNATIMHTDRGSQYCSNQFQRLLRGHGIRSSMSKKGDCYDNACAESFFHTLKVEAVHGEHFPTRDSMRSAVFDYIEVDYNRNRRHTTIGNQSPVNFELANAA